MKQRGGVILNMASIASMLGLPDRFCLLHEQGGCITMTYTVAGITLDYQIRCNSIAPPIWILSMVSDSQNYPGNEGDIQWCCPKT